MSAKAYVLSKYQLAYGTALGVDDFEERLAQIENNPKYEDVVDFVDECSIAYQLNRDALEDLSHDETVTEALRSFAQTLLDSGDPNHDYVRVEVR